MFIFHFCSLVELFLSFRKARDSTHHRCGLVGVEDSSIDSFSFFVSFFLLKERERERERLLSLEKFFFTYDGDANSNRATK